MKTLLIRSEYCTSNHVPRSYGHLGRRVDAELQLRLLAVGDGRALNEEGGEAVDGATAEAVEETGAIVGELPDVVEDQVDDILAHRVDLVHHGGLQAQEDNPGNRKSAQFSFRTSQFKIQIQSALKCLSFAHLGTCLPEQVTQKKGEKFMSFGLPASAINSWPLGSQKALTIWSLTWY